MNVIETDLPGVLIVEPKVFGDDRGFFMESWNARAFEAAGIAGPWVQDNHSRSARGVLRGLHYQVRQTQGKLVRATAGAVFDVVVDLRRSSPAFGKWMGLELSAENKRMLWVPPGFAHGFLTLTDTADFQYKCTDYYAPEWEQALLWNDPAIGVEWPLEAGQQPSLSAKDAAGLTLDKAETFE